MTETEGRMVTPTLRYFAPGIAQPGVVWCVEVPRTVPTYTRQLCTAMRMVKDRSKSAPVKAVNQQLTLF